MPHPLTCPLSATLKALLLTSFHDGSVLLDYVSIPLEWYLYAYLPNAKN